MFALFQWDMDTATLKDFFFFLFSFSSCFFLVQCLFCVLFLLVRTCFLCSLLSSIFSVNFLTFNSSVTVCTLARVGSSYYDARIQRFASDI